MSITSLASPTATNVKKHGKQKNDDWILRGVFRNGFVAFMEFGASSQISQA